MELPIISVMNDSGENSSFKGLWSNSGPKIVKKFKV